MMNRSLFCTLCLGALLATLAVPAWAASLGDVISALETPFQTKTDKTLRIYDYSADFFQESKIASLDRLQRANGRVEVSFDYQRPQTVPDVMFRWQYDQPTTQEIVSDGKTLWVYLPENNQVIQSDIEMINKSRQNDPMTFLTGLGNLSRDFQISWATPNTDIDGNYVLNLTPRRVSSLINRLVIVVDRFAVEAYQNRGQEDNSPQDPRLARNDPRRASKDLGPASRNPRLAPPTRRGDVAFPDYENDLNGLWFPIMSTTVYDPNGNSTIIEFSNLRVNLGISKMSFNFILPAGVQVVRPTGKEMGF
jgi:outer membrane lipoprotein carrier protein